MMDSRAASDALNPAPGRTSIVIIGFGTYDVSRHPRVGIVLDGLRAHGHEVLEINHPLGLSTAERVRMLAQPWRLPSLAFKMSRRWAALWHEARVVHRRGQTIDAVVVGYMGHFDVLLARLIFRRERIVLDHLIFAADTAQDRGASGLRVRILRLLDSRALRAADLVLVDTPQHLAMLPDTERGVVVPVGARAEWYDVDSRNTVDETRLSVIFFGLFTPLQGATVIAEALRDALKRGAPIRATLVGNGQDWHAAHELLGNDPALTWIDWVDSHELPTLVAKHDVCLGILATTEKAARVVPNKVFEGMAAGCAVVTSDTSPQRELLGDSALLVPAGDADALAEVLIDLSTSPSHLQDARQRARRGAEAFRAMAVVEPLIRALEEDS